MGSGDVITLKTRLNSTKQSPVCCQSWNSAHVQNFTDWQKTGDFCPVELSWVELSWVELSWVESGQAMWWRPNTTCSECVNQAWIPPEPLHHITRHAVDSIKWLSVPWVRVINRSQKLCTVSKYKLTQNRKQNLTLGRELK